MSKPISGGVFNSIYARLADPQFGFNAVVDEIADAYSLNPLDFQIDLDMEHAGLFTGNVDPEDILTPEDIHYPAVVITTSSSSNEDRSRPSMFSGEVVMRIVVQVTWEDDDLPKHTEAPGHLVEEVMNRVFNTTHPNTWIPAASGVVWTKQLKMLRQPVIEGGMNWIQNLVFDLKFLVVTR